LGSRIKKSLRQHGLSEALHTGARRLIIALSALGLMAAAVEPAPAIHEIDWRTSPLDLNLRGQNGERFCFRCPAGRVAAGQVIGSGPYTDGSSICAAAAHAGVIRPASGGVLTIEVRPGQAHYLGSLSHFVQSESYEDFWSGSFLVLPEKPSVPPKTSDFQDVPNQPPRSSHV
jgi:hypothetical protein